LAFYAATSGNRNAGHVMLSEGGGSYITAAATVRPVQLGDGAPYFGAPYLGWSYADPEWPGR
jgi:hypothetical protein